MGDSDSRARDLPIGPDDAGNAVTQAIGFLVDGWRWLVAKATNRR